MRDDLPARFEAAFGTPLPRMRLPDSPVHVVALCYNERLRLPDFLAHHRALGVASFIVVDNASTDGSAEYLAAQDDVLVISTERPYRDHKNEWRELIHEAFLVGRWGLFLDVDELFVAPDWPAPLAGYVARLEAAGAEAVFSIMLDMYPREPLTDPHASDGVPMIEAAPFFDGSGYHIFPIRRRMHRRFPTPPWKIFGGPRDRVLARDSERRPATAADRFLLKHLYPLDQGRARYLATRELAWRLEPVVKRTISAFAHVNSKVPLLKADRPVSFYGGVHMLAPRLKLAPDRAAILHFKYLGDFVEKARENVARGQHARDGGYYQRYLEKADRLAELYDPAISRRFEGVGSLLDAGLVLRRL